MMYSEMLGQEAAAHSQARITRSHLPILVELEDIIDQDKLMRARKPHEMRPQVDR